MVDERRRRAIDAITVERVDDLIVIIILCGLV